MTGLLELLAFGYAVFVTALVAYSAWMLTHPSRKTYAWAVSRGRPGDPSELPGKGRPYSSWTFKSRGRTFAVWDIPGDGAPGAATLILSHGWADSRLGGLVRMPFLAPVASRLILWDLRGHGEAPGACRLGTVEVEDLLALIETLARPVSGEAGAGPDPARATALVLFGWSLGAGVGIAAAARSDAIAGVIAEAPYRLPITPARNVMRGLRLPYRLNLPAAFWLLGGLLGVGPRWRGFDRAAHAARLRVPLMLIHGDQDPVCPVQDSRDIAAAAPRAELLVVPGGGHNNLWTDPAFAERCAAAVNGFVAGLGTGSPSPAGRLET